MTYLTPFPGGGLSEWDGGRLTDGRPKVPDAILERMKSLNLEEGSWSVCPHSAPGRHSGRSLDWREEARGHPVRGDHGLLVPWLMALLRPRDERPDFTTRRRIHTVVRCPLNGRQVGACRGLCKPSPEGDGLCGRLAPHALVGRTQAAIAAREAAQGEEASALRQASPPRPPRTLARPGGTHRGF